MVNPIAREYCIFLMAIGMMEAMKVAIKKIKPIQVESVITPLAKELNRLQVENKKIKKFLSNDIIHDGGVVN